MKKLFAAAAAVALVLSAPAMAGASSEYDTWLHRKVASYHVTYDLNLDGTMQVTIVMDYDFGASPGRGPVWGFDTRVGYSDDKDRLYPIKDVGVTSPTDAPARVHLEQGRNVLEIRAGEENITNVSGVHRYVLTYTQESVMNRPTDGTLPNSDVTEWDEFYWNVLSNDGTMPMRDVRITVNAPAELLAFNCAYGPRDTPCPVVSSSEESVEWHVDYVNIGHALAVATAYPVNTFDTEPNLIPSNDLVRAFAITPWTVGGGVIVLLVTMWRWIRALRTKAADEQFAGLIPGLAPAPGSEHHVKRRDTSTPVAVRFEPPPGLRPGQLGTLIDEKADVRDVTATMVDLAVRGYLRIEEAGTTGVVVKTPDYKLVKLRDADEGMYPYELLLFEGIFKGRSEVTLTGLKTTFAADMAKVQAQLYRNVTNMGWFRGNPNTARGTWFVAGAALAGGAAALAYWLASWSLSLIVAPAVLVGIGVMATTSQAPARTAEGTRVLMETLGFELFLETADGNQLRFEEGHDIFSQYLPYAISFGVADKWSGKFEELARQGKSLPEPTWYHGAYAGAFWANSRNFGAQMNQFTSLANSAMSAPTPGSSGGSGFGGGGGFSSGGGGGGRVGGW